MVESLCVVVVILSLTLVVGGFMGGPIVAGERKKAKAAQDDAKAKADELARAHKKALADATTVAGLKKELDEKTKDARDIAIRLSAAETAKAEAEKESGHLKETNDSLKYSIEDRDRDLAELAEHAAHFASLADSFRRKYGSKRTTT